MNIHHAIEQAQINTLDLYVAAAIRRRKKVVDLSFIALNNSQPGNLTPALLLANADPESSNKSPSHAIARDFISGQYGIFKLDSVQGVCGQDRLYDPQPVIINLGVILHYSPTLDGLLARANQRARRPCKLITCVDDSKLPFPCLLLHLEESFFPDKPDEDESLCWRAVKLPGEEVYRLYTAAPHS